MPEGPSGSSPDKSAVSGPQRGRKPSSPAISDDALAALERQYGGITQEPIRSDTEPASATGFAAILAQGSVPGGNGSSGAISSVGDTQESARRDGGEIPEAKIIEVREDVEVEKNQATSDPSVDAAEISPSDDPSASVIDPSTPVEEIEDLPVHIPPPAADRPAVAVRPRPRQSKGMPEHYKAFIPILIATGLGALGVGVWAVIQFADTTEGGGGASPPLFVKIAVLGVPLGLAMLGLSGFILMRYWKKK